MSEKPACVNHRFKQRIYMRIISAAVAFAAAFCTASFPAANIYADENTNPANTEIKNIIFMIPDGGGFGILDMAEAVKEICSGINGARTSVTENAVTGSTVKGLYLSEYLVGTAVTASQNSKIPDSAAAATALATGYKTDNFSVAIRPYYGPSVSLLEASQINGKKAGIVTTGVFYDATAAAFASHAESRTDYETITTQMLYHNLDVVLSGSAASDFDGTVTAKSLGYNVVNNIYELEAAVINRSSKVWSNFSSRRSATMTPDSESSLQPTLKEMTASAISLLSANSSENGFFLMVEGGQIDSGCHDGNALLAVSEYLAFDEAFAYAVNWAKNDGHTIVVAVPDHDTGGLTAPENEKKVANEIANRLEPDGLAFSSDNHTAQNVGISVYAPDGVKENLLSAMGLPSSDGAEKARTGRYYDGISFDTEYQVSHADIANGIAKTAKLDLNAELSELFVNILSSGSYSNGIFKVSSTGIQIPVNRSYYILRNGTKVDFKYGTAVYIGGNFYVPKSVAEADGSAPEIVWSNPFYDVSESDSFYDAVKFVYTNSLFQGTGNGKFEPMTNMNRAMYVTVLGRLAKADVSLFPGTRFYDVPEGKWYTGYVSWASQNKIVNGYGSGNFGPDDMITREQMMLIIYNFAKALGLDTSTTVPLRYSDVREIHDWARTAVVYCTAYKLVSASGGGDIRPSDAATRADVADIMMRFVTEVLKK